MTDDEARELCLAIGRYGKSEHQIGDVASGEQLNELTNRGLVEKVWIDMPETTDTLGGGGQGMWTYQLTRAGTDLAGLPPPPA